MLKGKSFVVFGVSRLGVRIILGLIQQNAHVTCMSLPEDDLSLTAQIPAHVMQIKTDHRDLVDLFRETVPADLSCLLAVADDDLQNVRCCVAAREVYPDIPVVLRAFDPALADQLESGLNVRRAYSASALSAPAFVAAALGSTVLETLRIADEEVSVCTVDVTSDSPLFGLKEKDILARYGCVLVGRAGLQSVPHEDQRAIEVGEEIVLGGLFDSVLEAGVRRPSAKFARQRAVSRAQNGHSSIALTYLPIVGWSLTSLILISVIVLWVPGQRLWWPSSILLDTEQVSVYN